MTVATSSTDTVRPSSKFLFDIAGLDLQEVVATREDIGNVNPHRGNMALLDNVAWISPDKTKAIGRVHFKGDEVWAAGHFPGKPLFPGVLMIEAGAQLANWLYNIRTPIENICALLGIDEARFRTPVEPGQTMYILIDSIRWTSKRFTSKVQGVLNGSIVFECTVVGIAIDSKKQ